MRFRNVYEDAAYAEAYAAMDFPGTYALAYSALRDVLAEHAAGCRALDFGCGAGRSTQFLRRLGWNAVGVDISAPMVARARALDPTGDYRLISDPTLAELPPGGYDLVLSAFTFDNVPTEAEKVRALRGLSAALAPGGRIVSLVSSPDIYTHEWASFSTRDYPENASARSGDVVRIVVTDLADRRAVEDILWTDESYRETYARAGLRVVARHAPLATGREDVAWVSETRVAPWVLWVLARD